jgi:hypothetical protein
VSLTNHHDKLNPSVGPAQARTGLSEEISGESKARDQFKHILSLENPSDTILTKINPYLQQILHPDKYAGSRIPTGGAQNTATFQTVVRGQFLVAAGMAGGIMLGKAQESSEVNLGCLIPPVANPVTGKDTYFGRISGSTNTSATLPFLAGSSRIQNTPYATALGDASEYMFDRVRLVSGSLEATCLASALNTAGEVVYGFATPGVMNAFGSDSGIDIVDIKNLPGSVVQALPKTNVPRVIYTPSDNSNLNFRSSSINADELTDDDELGVMYIIVVNLGTSAIQFDYTYNMHYEIIPSSAALSYVSTQPELNDPIQLADAMNKLKGTSTTSVSNAMNAKKPMFTSPALFDSFCESSAPLLYLAKASAPNHLGFSLTTKVKIKNAEVQPEKEIPMLDKILNAIVKVAPKVLTALL